MSAAVSAGVVAIITMKEERREADLHVAQLPLLDSVHLLEQSAAKRCTKLTTEPDLAPYVVADGWLLSRKSCCCSQDRRCIEAQVSPPLIAIQHRPDAHRQAFDAIVDASR